jgi:DNA-binding IclR family transcriptional regulator
MHIHEPATSDAASQAQSAAGGSGVDVLDRAVSILRAFRTAEGPLTLAELAARTGLYKSTLLRLAGALIHHGFLQRLADGRYRLGAAPLTLGAVYQSNLNLDDVLLPIMRELNQDLGEAISFHIREGDHRVCLFRIDSRFAIRPDVRPGAIQALDRGAGGRVLLAFTNEPGEPYDTVRRTFCYMSSGERDPDTAGISGPVFGAQQAIAGALGIVAPVSRLTREEMERLRPRLLMACADATRLLGGDPTHLIAAASAGAAPADAFTR